MIARGTLLRFTATTIVLAGHLMGAEHRVAGMSASGMPIEALVVAGAPPAAPTVLLLGGLNGGSESAKMVFAAVQDLESDPPSRRTTRLRGGGDGGRGVTRPDPTALSETARCKEMA